MGKRQAER
jgi:hypothetical protein